MATDILIVEDESIVALDLEHRLNSMGFHVVGRAGTGMAALDMVERTPPQVVLMDIQLRGDMDGISTADRIEETHDIPVIFLTAFSDPESLERAKRANAYGYLLKPFQERELSIAVELALYKHRAEREIRESQTLLDITLNNVSEAIITADRTGCILFMNRAAERLTGWRLAEAIGTELSAVVQHEAGDHPYSSAEHWTRLTPRGGTPRTVAVSTS
ncbi:MAG TPA: response regulator, partial [Alkalispirochaeta sp.]|nr:response regulator [Alkalispirochaeta sp.]